MSANLEGNRPMASFSFGRKPISPAFSTKRPGFRRSAPLASENNRAIDVAMMLLDLMRDCRVTDVRVIAGAQADRDPGTGLPLLFRADAVPDGAVVVFH